MTLCGFCRSVIGLHLVAGRFAGFRWVSGFGGLRGFWVSLMLVVASIVCAWMMVWLISLNFWFWCFAEFCDFLWGWYNTSFCGRGWLLFRLRWVYLVWGFWGGLCFVV